MAGATREPGPPDPSPDGPPRPGGGDAPGPAGAPSLDRILERVHAGLWAIDAGAVTTFANPALAAMLGRSVEQIVGSSLYEHIDDAARASVRTRLAGLERGESVTLALTLRARDGGEVAATMHAAPLFDGAGRYEGAVASLLATSAEQRAILEHLDQLSRTVDAVLWIAGPGEPPRISFVSPAAREVLGRPAESLTGSPKSWLACVHPEDRHRVEASRRFVLRGEVDAFEEEYRVVLPGGETRWILEKARVLRGPEGAALRVYGIATDVSEHWRAEKERRLLDERLGHKQRLESLGVLAGGVAHEFNNLLLVVIGNAEIGASLARDEPEVREIFEEILASGQRAALLSRQMLAYSGRGGLERRRVCLAALARETRAMLELAAGKTARLEIASEDGTHEVTADASQLRQMLVNVVTNAGEALPAQGGSVRVSIGSRHCAGEELDNPHLEEPLAPGRYVSLEVLDDGEGMEASTLERLFDPFFSTRFPGRGLGMSAVLGILRGHGGAINVESRRGLGTRVEILLPAALPAKPDSEGSGRPAADAAVEGGTVLLVDDQASIRALGSKMLRRLGFDALCTESGFEALELIRERPRGFRAVLLDLTMPGISGARTYEMIRREFPALPVVLCSGYGRESVMELLGQKTPEHVLHKPFRLEQMRQVLLGALARPPQGRG